MNIVTVYTKPNCVQCQGTKRWLKRHGIEFSTVDVTKDAESLAAIKSLGYTSAPVVVVSDGEHLRKDAHWSGLRPDLLESILLDRKAA